MTGERRNILNRILREWTPDSVVVSPWLESRGVYQQLAHEYEKSGWMRRIGRGAYVRPGDIVEWDGALLAVQEQLGLPIHVAGKTALQLQGYAHFLPLGKGGTLFLFGLPGTRLPAWFRNYDWESRLRYITTNLFDPEKEVGLTKKEFGRRTIIISTPERAILEVLYLVPGEESFSEAEYLLEGLATLRPRLVQELLEQCRSIKVKRLFMYLVEKANHVWAKRLEPGKINLGSGKRLIVKGGRYDPKYKITVPGSGP